ncbi:hypothetical protein V8C37DRAFT_369559 [Trichoderma ceciliae]
MSTPLLLSRVFLTIFFFFFLFCFCFFQVGNASDYRPKKRDKTSNNSPPKTTNPSMTSQKIEMGNLGASLVRFLTWSSDLPMRASWSLANLALRRRCSRVWAIVCFVWL